MLVAVVVCLLSTLSFCKVLVRVKGFASRTRRLMFSLRGLLDEEGSMEDWKRYGRGGECLIASSRPS
jgi:hypothetical protein